MGTFRQEHVRLLLRAGSVWVVFIAACTVIVLESPAYVTATLEISTDDPTGRIAAGLAHTCAIAQNNTIWCWGDNSLSQLGSSAYNTITDSLSVVPVQTAALGGGRIAQRIVAGLNHTCVLATDGTVWCWGENGKGSVGDGSFTNQENPVQVTLANSATKIAAGGSTTCAVLTNKSVQCWGHNNFGQVGIGSVLSSTIGTPTTVLLIPGYSCVCCIHRWQCLVLGRRYERPTRRWLGGESI
jgi:alpha-tubulin suppressor-like RCC1 family protein